MKADGEHLDPATAGLRALSEGRWADARIALEAAARGDERPELLEGLSWAAWWLDDAPAVFEAREQAYRLYHRRGDAGGAARMAIWLAIDHLDFHGATAVATGWLRRAARLLDGRDEAPEHGWLAFQEGYLAHLRGDTATAMERARVAAEVGRRFGVADLEMLGLALEGGALVASADVAAGMRCLDEATATALVDETAVPISSAWTFCFLVTACLDVRDYRRAFEWNDRIAEFARRHDSRYMLGFCRSHYGAVHLERGRWTDAETELVGAIDAYERSRPAMASDPIVWLAELRRRQGQHGEASALIDRAGEGPAAQLCRGRLALDLGDPARAAELARRCLRQTPEDRLFERAPAMELLVHAAAAHGDVAQAGRALGDLQKVAVRIDAPALQASLEHARGAVAMAKGDREDARRHLEDSAEAFDRAGATFEGLTTRLDLAECEVALGRRQVAEENLRRTLAQLDELGAQREAARARRLLQHAARESVDPSPMAGVTRREREVLSLVAEGLTNREIAERLVVSEHTVHRHVTNILRKLDLRSRAAAAALAAASGALSEEAETDL